MVVRSARGSDGRIKCSTSAVLGLALRKGPRSWEKGSYGFHLLTAWCDNLQAGGTPASEALTIVSRAGNTAADHIEIIDATIEAIHTGRRHRLLITVDAAGSSRQVIDRLTDLNARARFIVEYSIGLTSMPESATHRVCCPTTRGTRHSPRRALPATTRRPPRSPACSSQGYAGGTLGAWPAGMRILALREAGDDGAQASPFEQTNGYRYQRFVANTGGSRIQILEARRRAHARVEGFIRCAREPVWPGCRRPRSR